MNLKYKRPSIKKDIDAYKTLLKELKNSKTKKEQLTIIEQINKIRDNFFSMYWLSYINYLLDVESEYWNKEENFYAKYDPVMDNLKLKYYEILNNSKFKEELKKEIGTKVFKIADYETRLINDEIFADLTKEKELSNSYTKLLSSAKVIFNNEEIPLSKLSKHLSSLDRDTRIKASAVRYEYFNSIKNKLDDILDDLIKVRTTIAKKLGFSSFTEVGYIKMKRLDYGKKEIKVFRENIINDIVPLVTKLKEAQRKELGLDKLMYYDDAVLFKDGNAIPKGDTKWIVKQATKMYRQISTEISDTFNKMNNEGLMDLAARKNKKAGGITTYIPNYKVPVIISSLTNTSYDIKLLTHEFGHSFQLYSSRNLKYYENWWPTFDSCEIHSSSMELLTMPYMELFFGEEKDKYKKEIIHSFLIYLCYAALVDEFQHVLYDEPNLSKIERKKRWRDLEKIYMPWLNYDGNKYLIEGNMWHKQSHIFQNPFYFIDYALAYTVSLQLYSLSLNKQEEAWSKYIELCKQGGAYSFIESLEKNNLISPFKKDALKSIIENIDIN